ncbi:MAG: FCD domain-containing protein, partial [Deltaproteobacteria bacterium]|nr:FCD domain-containing protein [Deltaproteobacteria bacterium]
RQFQVSRPTIREALKRLAAQSLIRSRRGATGGSFINRPSREEVSSNLTTATALLVSLGEFKIPEILEARQELELLCVRQAVARSNQPELHAMAREVEVQQQESISDEDFCASDVRFHRAIADATHNSVLKFVMFTVIEALQPIENMAVYRVRERKVIARQHEEILAALRAKDVEAASETVREQTAYLRERFDAAQEMRESRPRFKSSEPA